MFSRPLLPYLAGVINYSVAFSSFPDEIKLAKVMSGFKKDDPLYKKKLSHNTFISHISKTFEKLLFNQFDCYIEP